MAAFNKFNQFVENLAGGKVNLASDTFKVFLTNTAPVATNSVYGNISANDLSTANGYTNGGTAVTITSALQTSGTLKWLVAVLTVVTASGAVGPFRYAVLYDSSAVTKTLVGWWDYGSSISLASGDSFTVSFDQTNGVLQIA